MPPRTIKLLHVEDDVLQQRVIAHHLGAISEFNFDIVAVESEDLAIAAFQPGRFELVILDYQLAQGDGLHLLKQLRRLDPIVPIIGISGVAPAEVAAELVRAGADDYFEKSHLDSAKLAKAIRAVLLRAESLSSLVARQTATWHAVESKLLELCRTYAQKR